VSCADGKHGNVVEIVDVVVFVLGAHAQIAESNAGTHTNRRIKTVIFIALLCSFEIRFPHKPAEFAKYINRTESHRQNAKRVKAADFTAKTAVFDFAEIDISHFCSQQGELDTAE